MPVQLDDMDVEARPQEFFVVRYRGLGGPHSPERPGIHGSFDDRTVAETERDRCEHFFNNRCQRRIELAQKDGLEIVVVDETTYRPVCEAWIDEYSVQYDANGKVESRRLVKNGMPQKEKVGT